MTRRTPIVPLDKEATIRGFRQSSLFIGLGVTAALMFLLSFMMGGIPLILISAGIGYTLIIPLVEFVREKIPKNYVPDALDWLISGDKLYITSDAAPIPLVLYSERELAQRREEQLKAKRKKAAAAAYNH